MKYKGFLTLLIIGVLWMSIASCTRSKTSDASSAPVPTPTIAGVVQPSPDDVMSQLELFVTQTAIAGGLVTQPTVHQPTGDTSTDSAQDPGTEVTSTPSSGEATAMPTLPQPSPTPLPTEEPLPTAIPVPSATPGIPTTYTIHGGEHIYCISRRFNVNPADVMAINGLTSSIVFSGMTLNIPQNGNPFPGDRSLIDHPTTYIVAAGDTIYSIACQFGDVDPYAIAYANGLSEPFALSVGQTLNIP